MVKSVLSSPHEIVMQNSLGAAALRHKVISDNIANVNTPGFKRSDVAFAHVLDNAMQPAKPVLARTHERHLAGRQQTGAAPSVVTDNTTTLRTDGNNVDIDIEMANMAKNTIYYDAVAQMLGRHYSSLKSAINEGRK